MKRPSEKRGSVLEAICPAQVKETQNWPEHIKGAGKCSNADRKMQSVIGVWAITCKVLQ